jgi:hypothetical protein
MNVGANILREVAEFGISTCDYGTGVQARIEKFRNACVFILQSNVFVDFATALGQLAIRVLQLEDGGYVQVDDLREYFLNPIHR